MKKGFNKNATKFALSPMKKWPVNEIRNSE